MTDETRLMLIDGHSLVHRAYHALPPLSTSEGELTNAVFGFSSMLLKAIDTVRPTHVIMALDRALPTFRHKAFPDYKATRPPTPHELVSQFRRVREVADAMNVEIYELDGFEADDVLGTLTAQAEREGISTVVVTGDLDALQLVSQSVNVLTPKRGIAETVTYDPDAVRDRFELEPSQLPDWKALVGDVSDNIPGVKGIGEKTASRLLGQYRTLEGIFEHIDDIGPKLREALEPYRDQAFQSRELARIIRDAPVSLSLEHSAFRDIDRAKLINLFRELEFRSLIERVQGIMPRTVETSLGTWKPPATGPRQLNIFGESDQEAVAAYSQEVQDGDGSFVSSSLGLLDEPTPRTGQTVTRVVHTAEDLDELVMELRAAGTFCMDTETTSTDALRAELVGLSFATRADQAWYVPVGHVEGTQLPVIEVIGRLRPLLEDPDLRKVGHNLKYDYTVLHGANVAVEGLFFDTMIAAYLVNPTARSLSLSSLALARLGVEMTPIESLIGKGKNQRTMDMVDIGTAAAYAGADADVTLRLQGMLQAELVDRELERLFHDVEMPLVAVLADMERSGVSLDTGVLDEMSRDMTELIGNLEGQIYEIAGHRFNINSTQQLGLVLFQELKLPHGRRTKSGYSTDSEVLEALRGKHEIIDLILEYRQLVKLKNTYIDALPALISPVDGRVHTDFNQTSTATGRLSSSAPNLQNIPIRGEVGRRIRRAFVPSRAENRLLAADYSQIELRILAAVSGDERLVTAFRTGEDIHSATAAAVFGVPLDEVTSDQRRIAKVVNFGIIYGIGEARLAHETGISRQEAAEFIANYNQTYSGVKSFMDGMRRRAAYTGYVSTLLGRRRYTPDIHSENPGIRQAAERAAINMPIQGTAADIIKIAMVRAHKELGEKYPATHLVLQVHDELVFDVPEQDLLPVAELVRDVMETALKLEVPIEVEVQSGRDWYDLEAIQPVAV